MSVIPLTTKGPSPSLLTDENKFSFEGRTILGKNLDAAQLNPTGDDCNISYDLRVGSIYRDHRDTGGIELEEGGTIQIRPGTAYIIQTEESIKVPKGVFGQITPKGRLAELVFRADADVFGVGDAASWANWLRRQVGVLSGKVAFEA